MNDNIDINTLMEGTTDTEVTDVVEAEGSNSILGKLIFMLLGVAIGAGGMFVVDKILIKKKIEAWMDDILSDMPEDQPRDDVSAKRAEKSKEKATDDETETSNDNN